MRDNSTQCHACSIGTTVVQRSFIYAWEIWLHLWKSFAWELLGKKMELAYAYACTQTHAYIKACACAHTHTHTHTYDASIYPIYITNRSFKKASPAKDERMTMYMGWKRWRRLRHLKSSVEPQQSCTRWWILSLCLSPPFSVCLSVCLSRPPPPPLLSVSLFFLKSYLTS